MTFKLFQLIEYQIKSIFMKNPCRKCAPKVNSRPLFNFIKQPKTAIAYKELFYKSDILKENFQKALKKITLLFFRKACHPYDTRMAFVCHVICMSLTCSRMSSVCHSYVLVCHPYVTLMYSYVIRISLVCTRMSLVCTGMYSYVTRMYSYVTRMSLVCHPCVTRMYSYVIRISLACHSYILVSHLYVLVCTHMSLVCTRMSLLCHSYVIGHPKDVKELSWMSHRVIHF